MFSNLSYLTFSIVAFLLLIFWFLISLRIKESKNSNFLKNYRYRFSKNKKYIVLFLSFLFVSIALLEPRWFGQESSSWVKNWDVIFLVDVTRSMDARDIDLDRMNISRLDLTKKIIAKIINEQDGFNYWLVAFSWKAKKISPITEDKELVKILANGLSYETLLLEWLNYEDSIKKALELLNSKSWSLVMFTDGGENKLSVDNIKQIIPEDVSLTVIWVGWGNPVPIPTGVNFFWEYDYKTYNWEVIKTSLNKENIEALWELWRYYIAGSWNFKKIWEEIFSWLSEMIYESNLKQKKNLSLYFIVFSFIFFVTYVWLLSFEKKRI